MKVIKGRYYAYKEEIWKCTAINKRYEVLEYWGVSADERGECFHIVYPRWSKDYPLRDMDYGFLSPRSLSLNALIDNYQPEPHTPLIAKFVRGALKQLAKDLTAN